MLHSFDRGEFVEIASFFGNIVDIRPASALGAKTDDPIGIVSHEFEDRMVHSWIPLIPEHGLKAGDRVKVTDWIINRESGGSLTIVNIELATEA